LPFADRMCRMVRNDPVDVVGDWLEQVHDVAWDWDKWAGKLLRWVWRRDHPRFLRWVRSEIAIDGDDWDDWQKLVAFIESRGDKEGSWNTKPPTGHSLRS